MYRSRMGSLGRYEIIEELGEGSMGVVYKARDPILDRVVAIKRILVKCGEGREAAEFRERFFREARAAARLSHPGIVAVFDVAEHEGSPFLVMEYIAGRTLLSRLRNGERMGLDRACDVGIQLAEALDYAHRNGVIHRDIKPANILVTSDGRIKIADFGIAKLIESELTAKGQLLGTPAFMAPEQFIGMPIDCRSDLFSAGVVIYCMATGEKPFSGDTVIGIQYKVMHTDPVPPRKLNPAISPPLQAVILKSIQKDPLQRYPSGEELARNLRRCVSGESISKVTDTNQTIEQTILVTSNKHDGVDSPRRINAALIALTFFLITLLASAAVYLVKNTRRPKAATTDLAAQIVPTAVTDKNPPPVLAGDPSEPALSMGASNNAVAPETEDSKKSQKTIAEKRRVPLEIPEELQPQPITLSEVSSSPAALPANQEQPKVESVDATTPQPEPPPQPADQSPPKNMEEPIVTGPPQDPGALYKSARLLIASAAVPDPLTIIVSVDNELLFSRNGAIAPPADLQDHPERIELQSFPTTPLSEERPLPPGRHRLQVYAMLASRRVAKVQEVTERFYSGQRRILQIEFLLENQGSHGHDAKLFKITVK